MASLGTRLNSLYKTVCERRLKEQETRLKALIGVEIQKNVEKDKEIHNLQQFFKQTMDKIRKRIRVTNKKHMDKMKALQLQCKQKRRAQFEQNNALYLAAVADNDRLRDLLRRHEGAGVLESMGRKRQRTSLVPNLVNLRY